MTTPFHNLVALDGITFPEKQITFLISGSSLTAANTVGKAASLDTGAANTVKLAADGDMIIGRIIAFEPRVTGGDGINVVTVALEFINELPVKSGETVAIGDTVVGAGSGEVKTYKVSSTSAPRHWDNYVVATRTGFVTVVKI